MVGKFKELPLHPGCLPLRSSSFDKSATHPTRETDHFAIVWQHVI